MYKTYSFQIADELIYVYFTAEMIIKMVNMMIDRIIINIIFEDCSGSIWQRMLLAGDLEQT